MPAPSCTISPSGSSTVVTSYSLQIISGSLSSEFGAVLEELTTPGVQGQRHREWHRKIDDLVVEISEDTTSGAGIMDRESRYQQAEGLLADVVLRIADGQRTFREATIVSVEIVARLGPLHGSGAKVGSKHTIVSRWTIRPNKRGT